MGSGERESFSADYCLIATRRDFSCEISRSHFGIPHLCKFNFSLSRLFVVVVVFRRSKKSERERASKHMHALVSLRQGR
jgi:hypothetical protein